MIASAERGGFSAVVTEARDLIDRGCDVTLLCPHGPRLHELPSGVRHSPLTDSSRGVLKAARESRRWVRDQGPHLVHLHGRSAGVTGRLGLAGLRVPVAYTPHGVHPPDSQPALSLDRIVQRVLLSQVDLFLFVGDSEREDWQLAYTAGSSVIKLLPNIVDVESFRSVAVAQAISPTWDVLVPGAYQEPKMFEDVVRACAECDDPPVVRFVGSEVKAPGRREFLKHLASELGLEMTIRLDDEAPKLPEVLASSRLVMFPSRAEGMPITALEALAIDVPCAWSDIPAHREVFGATGARFEVGDHEGIARILMQPSEWEKFRPGRERADIVFNHFRSARAEGLDALIEIAEGRSDAGAG